MACTNRARGKTLSPSVRYVPVRKSAFATSPTPSLIAWSCRNIAVRRESLQDGVHLALTIFVGFSTETLAIAQQVQSELQPLARAKVWNRGAFKLGEGGLESLVDELARHDFAILVFSPDGITNSRRKYTRSPRDNVIFELGLFMGRLGPRRTFVLYDQTQSPGE